MSRTIRRKKYYPSKYSVFFGIISDFNTQKENDWVIKSDKLGNWNKPRKIVKKLTKKRQRAIIRNRIYNLIMNQYHNTIIENSYKKLISVWFYD